MEKSFWEYKWKIVCNAVPFFLVICFLFYLCIFSLLPFPVPIVPVFRVLSFRSLFLTFFSSACLFSLSVLLFNFPCLVPLLHLLSSLFKFSFHSFSPVPPHLSLLDYIFPLFTFTFPIYLSSSIHPTSLVPLVPLHLLQQETIQKTLLFTALLLVRHGLFTRT